MPNYGSLYQAAGNQWGIDPLLLQSMANEESDENPNAVGPVIQSGPAAGQRALGFMQFLPGTAKQYSVDTNNPSSSVYGASNYMADLLYKQNLPIRQALATYGGTAGNPNSDYVNTVMGRYKALKSAWSAPAATAPATDSDPSSPTYGQPTTRNFNPPANAPAVDTTAKGNPGQPAPNVPTTDTGPGVSMAAPGLVPPEQGGPSGQRKPPATPAAPDYLAPFKEGKPIAAAPAAPTSPAAPAPAAAGDQPPDYLAPFKEGQPIGGGAPPAMDTGEYLTAPTSPGAKAVGTQPSGTPIAEGRVPGPDFQAAINLATDPAQKARIAGHWLFPNDPPGQAADRIIIGPGGRMAAVPDSGQPYFIEPAPVFNPQTGYTREGDQGPNLRQLMWSGSGAVSDNANQPPGPWQEIGPGYVSPYSRAAPLGPGATAANIPLAMGGAIPGTVQNYLTAAPAGAGPILGPPLVGLASAGTTAARNMLANYFDPDQSQHVPLLTPQDTKQAMYNAAAAAGFGIGGKMLAPEIAATVPRGGPTNPLATIPTSPTAPQWPFGGGIGPQEANRLAASTQFPATAARPGYSPFARAESREPMPIGPSVPLEAKPLEPGMVVNDAQRSRRLLEAPGAPGEPGVQLNPAGEAAAASGPYAPSKAEEVAAIPTAVPVSRKPILTQAQAANRADELIRYFAAQGPTDADTRTLVPGSSGTLAGVTGNAGLASLERLVRNIPEAANRFAGADTANKEAERTFTANLVGTPEDVARGEAQRDAATSAARQAAFANKTSTDPSEQVAAIDKVLQGPAGKRPAIALPLRQIRGLFYTVNPETGAQELETDPEMLYGVRQAITDALGPLSRGTDRDARAAAAQLQPILNGLDATIEAGAPGFRDYLAQFHDLSQPIDAMKFLQSRNLTDANGYPLLRPVDTLLKDIQKQRTLQPGIRPADALSDDQISQLENLRDDLRRGANLGKGKAIGSNTVQNLVGNQTLNMLTRPAAQEVGKAVATTFGGLPGYLATGAAENVLSGAVQRRQGWVLDALIDRLLNKDNLGVQALTRPGAVPLPGAGAPQTIAR